MCVLNSLLVSLQHPSPFPPYKSLNILIYIWSLWFQPSWGFLHPQTSWTVVHIVFQQQPNTSQIDKSLIVFATTLWEQDSHFLSLLSELFISEIRKVFDHPVRGREAANWLPSLHQGNRPVVEYTVQLRILAAESSWDETSL